ncbi:MAG: PDDEXK nuclease domain-containing protein [Bacteroidales bacterium]|jgi:predicted nuclease of restriction endonuclease-like (RecB) superfamily|nr:PDDEXK nuclease domain-containing protein [Bacteroidales bacterium]
MPTAQEYTDKMGIESINNKSNQLLLGIENLIEQKSRNVAVYLNTEVSHLYWSIGNYILIGIGYEFYSGYGTQIIATLSRTLTEKYGRGYTYSALNRMVKVAEIYTEEIFATVSRTLSWSHFIELISIEDSTKRLFYQQMCIAENWSIRTLRQKEEAMLFERTAIAAKPEEVILQALQEADSTNLNPDLVFKNTYIVDFLGLSGYFSEKDLEVAILNQLEKFILELGQGFAFLERQKRIPIDSIDYHLDLLFYHRKLNRLVAIDLKLGKFKPKYKGQMELYLKYLQKYEKQPHENSPMGLLLCSEGNTEHIELLMLGEENIKVAQYLTAFPNKQWFIEKLQRATAIAREHYAELAQNRQK